MALETTSAAGGVALLRDGELAAERDLDAGRYSAQLFSAMTDLARGAGLALAQVDAFAVANGPGSFTGARVGLTAVKGLIEVWGKPAVAVSTLAAVAAAAEVGGPVWAVLDAAREEVYAGEYGAGGGEGHPLAPERLERLDNFLARWGAAPEAVVVTPHEKIAAACRSGGEARPGLASAAAGSAGRVRLIAPRLAAAVGRVGARRLARGEGSADPLRLDANYLRRSDAEIFLRA